MKIPYVSDRIGNLRRAAGYGLATGGLLLLLSCGRGEISPTRIPLSISTPTQSEQVYQTPTPRASPTAIATSERSVDTQVSGVPKQAYCMPFEVVAFNKGDMPNDSITQIVPKGSTYRTPNGGREVRYDGRAELRITESNRDGNVNNYVVDFSDNVEQLGTINVIKGGLQEGQADAFYVTHSIGLGTETTDDDKVFTVWLTNRTCQ